MKVKLLPQSDRSSRPGRLLARLLFWCLLIMCFFLVGCGKNGEADGPGRTEESAEDDRTEAEEKAPGSQEKVIFDMMSEGTPLNGFFTVARVDEIHDDGSLTLTRFMRVVGHEDYVIVNYANVNFDCYGPASKQLEGYVPEGATFMRAEKGSLKQASMKDLEEGDMIVSCFPDFHQEVLVIYKKVSEEESAEGE